jgi:uncharacterized protein (UPF0216 family)
MSKKHNNNEVLFDEPEYFELRTSGGSSLRVSRQDEVHVNDRVVGRSRRVFSSMIAHLVRCAVPNCELWLPSVTEERPSRPERDHSRRTTR